MQSTSDLYKELIAEDGHYFITRVIMNSVTYDENVILSARITRSGMPQNKPSIGGALSAQLELTMIEPSDTIPKMADVRVYHRIRSGSRVSEFIRDGIFWIDTRSVSVDNGGVHVLRITAFDAMMKAEQDYPDTEHSWPARDTTVLSDIASAIGVTVDARTTALVTAGYMIGLPTEYSMREVLQNIASAYCGNFVISNNKLLLVPLYGNDPDEITGNYLADANGTTAIQAGSEEWFILV